METTTNAGTEFTFEFLDEDGDGSPTGDAYSSAAVDHRDGSEIFNVGISEAFFADGIDITNGDSIRVDFIEKGHSPRHPRHGNSEKVILYQFGMTPTRRFVGARWQ